MSIASSPALHLLRSVFLSLLSCSPPHSRGERDGGGERREQKPTHTKSTGMQQQAPAVIDSFIKTVILQDLKIPVDWAMSKPI